MTSRRLVLVTVLATTLVVAGAVLHEVWAAVVFAVTVAYVLVPLRRRLTDRGLSAWWASTVATVVGTLAALVPIVVAGFLGYRRRDSISAFLRDVPDTLDLTAFGVGYAVDLDSLLRGVEATLSATLVSIAGGLPELALKATLFAFVVFGLLSSHEAVEDALMAVVPREHRRVVESLVHRIDRTLHAIYVLQAATAAATFAVGVAVFWMLGYDVFMTLAFLSGLLQFLPVVGPSVLIVTLAVYHVVVGDVGSAIAVLTVAGVFVAYLPDVLVRPRLSRRTGDLPGTLYYVGFVGGLLTVGAIGIVVGPLAVALVAEALTLLTAEYDDAGGTSEADVGNVADDTSPP